MEDTTLKHDNDNTRLDYADQLHVWISGLRLGIFGIVRTGEHDLLTDRDLAVIELNNACDGVAVTAQNLRTIVDKFRHLKAPYSSYEPRYTVPRKPHKVVKMTAYELSQIGPHLRGLMDRPRASEAAA